MVFHLNKYSIIELECMGGFYMKNKLTVVVLALVLIFTSNFKTVAEGALTLADAFTKITALEEEVSELEERLVALEGQQEPEWIEMEGHKSKFYFTEKALGVDYLFEEHEDLVKQLEEYFDYELEETIHVYLYDNEYADLYTHGARYRAGHNRIEFNVEMSADDMHYTDLRKTLVHEYVVTAKLNGTVFA